MRMQNEQDKLDYPHFALIYIDWAGNLRHEASKSIANSRETILSLGVTDAFLRAVVWSNEAVVSHSLAKQGTITLASTRMPPSGQIRINPHLNRAPNTAEVLRAEGYHSVPVPPVNLIQPAVWPQHQAAQQEIRHRWSRQVTKQQPRPKAWSQKLNMNSQQKTLISIRDKYFLRQYYEKAFQNLQQINCRVLAKAYVKLVEPRKQVHYPYNGRKIVAGRTQQLEPDGTKPPWWPSGVNHREPDHLLKAERIRLLVHILCQLQTSHGITARRLKEADQSIRRQISPANRLEILDEIYQVREEEEKFLEGTNDVNTMVSIVAANLPVALETPVSQGGGSRKRTTIEEISGHKQIQPTENTAIRPIRGINAPQPAFTTCNLPPNLSPGNPWPPSHNQNSYLSQGFPIHPVIDSGASSWMSEQVIRRKRQCVETEPPTTTSLNTTGCNSPILVSSHLFMPEPNEKLQNFQNQGIPTAPQPVTELYGEPTDPSCAFPSYFDASSLCSP
ncbi:uncharacterized protein N7458_000598 [Penicillium daleae]|uniref:Subtelomeric hrmA-associated cluster protein AFUB-079030/YDR124W-like helical bundle domain-containing protein n=1 Tax=Penicillium daleae TaxID=63821 RepID=A0AAD6CGL6_9EURO|nr:uncharacterized protein N7458_000598 [Penicillium daleae]KAJ5464912.1 hypothetical protein N7458_000598 [Penicillium daleae]